MDAVARVDCERSPLWCCSPSEAPSISPPLAQVRAGYPASDNLEAERLPATHGIHCRIPPQSAAEGRPALFGDLFHVAAFGAQIGLNS